MLVLCKHVVGEGLSTRGVVLRAGVGITSLWQLVGTRRGQREDMEGTRRG